MSEISEKEIVEQAVQAAIDAGLAVNGEHGVAAARHAARAALEAAAHARAEAVGVKDASYTEMLIDNAACASQCDFDAVTREAIRLNIIDPLLALAHPAVPEVAGWLYEDDLPPEYPYDAMFPFSKVDGVRLFPVFVPSTAAEKEGE